jgi:hypothetical protein
MIWDVTVKLGNSERKNNLDAGLKIFIAFNDSFYMNPLIKYYSNENISVIFFYVFNSATLQLLKKGEHQDYLRTTHVYLSTVEP